MSSLNQNKKNEKKTFKTTMLLTVQNLTKCAVPKGLNTLLIISSIVFVQQ